MFERILVAIDGSNTSQRALNAALDLATSNGAILRAIYVLADPPVLWDAPGYDPSIVRAALAEEGERLRAETTRLLGQRGVHGDALVVDAGVFQDIADCIVRTAMQFRADILVLGTHGRRGVRRLVLGSVAERCVRLAALPVLLVPGRMPEAVGEPEGTSTASTRGGEQGNGTTEAGTLASERR